MAVAEGEVVWVAGGLSSCNIEIPIPGMDTFSVSKDVARMNAFIPFSFRPVMEDGVRRMERWKERRVE